MAAPRSGGVRGRARRLVEAPGRGSGGSDASVLPRQAGSMVHLQAQEMSYPQGAGGEGRISTRYRVYFLISIMVLSAGPGTREAGGGRLRPGNQASTSINSGGQDAEQAKEQAKEQGGNRSEQADST